MTIPNDVLEAFQLHPQGSPDQAYFQLRYAIRQKTDHAGNKLTKEYILGKWKEYIEMCKADERESRYIKMMEHFINESMYLGDYKRIDIKHNNILDRWLDGIL